MSMEIRHPAVVAALLDQHATQTEHASQFRTELGDMGRWLAKGAPSATGNDLHKLARQLADTIRKLADAEGAAHELQAIAVHTCQTNGWPLPDGLAPSQIEAAAREAVANGNDRQHLLGKTVTVHLTNGAYHRGDLARDDSVAVVLDSPLGPISLAPEGVASIEPYQAAVGDHPDPHGLDRTRADAPGPDADTHGQDGAD